MKFLLNGTKFLTEENQQITIKMFSGNQENLHDFNKLIFKIKDTTLLIN